MFTSLRSRLITAYVGLVFIGFGGLTLLAGQQIASSAYDDFGVNLHIHALLLATQLAEPLHDESLQTAVSLMQNSADERNAQVVLFSPSGQVQYSTDEKPVSFVRTDSYWVQPNGDDVDTFYVSVPVNDGDDMSGYLQLSVPSSVPQTAVSQRWMALGAAFVLFSLLGLAISFWLLTAIIKPLAQLEQTALKMADGDLTQRINPISNDEIGHLGATFNTMAARIEAMMAEQRAFTGNASHELRTPLTTIRLRTEWLQSGELDGATSQQYISEIDSEARRMSRLVEDLLLLSRLDAKRLDVGKEQLDIARLWQVLEHEYKETAVSKDITLTIQPNDTPLAPIQANLNHAQVVFRNILDNALKYTPAGGIVTVSMHQREQYIHITVADTGRGIAAEALPHIGKRFYRTDKARSRQIQGTGLGLSLVESIVQLYGGRVEITSPGVDKGTAVTVDWPIA